MFETEVTERLNIEYPIILGGMVWICMHELCAAVSEAGGLGVLAGGSMTTDELKGEIESVRERTKKPFGVNIPLKMQVSRSIYSGLRHQTQTEPGIQEDTRILF